MCAMSPSAVKESMKNPLSASKNPVALATKAPYMDATRNKRVKEERAASRDRAAADQQRGTDQINQDAQAMRDQAEARRRRTLIGG